jgi:hypothetical protein
VADPPMVKVHGVNLPSVSFDPGGADARLYVSNGVQHSENVRNSLVLNYKSAALNQLSYAGVPIRKLFSAS